MSSFFKKHQLFPLKKPNLIFAEVFKNFLPTFMILIFYEKHKAARHSQRNYFAWRKKDHLHGNCQTSYCYKVENSDYY
jgi:hypothetical protein